MKFSHPAKKPNPAATKKLNWRIGIDCRLAGTKHGGIGRYIEELITRLPELSSEIEWVFFVDQSYSLPKEFGPNVEIAKVNVKHYSLKEQLFWGRFLDRYQLDLIHIPHFNVPWFLHTPSVITIHDLLWHEMRGIQVTTLPSWQYWLKYVAYRLVSSKAVTQAKVIIAPTQAVKNTIIKFYPSAKKKITVTLEGFNHLFAKQTAAQKKNAHQLIYVGSLYPHKNIKVVLQALKLDPNLSLIICTARNAFTTKTEELAAKMEVQSRVTIYQQLSDQELIKHMSESVALVQPSLSEGFGLTGLEALAMKLPIIVTDIPVFKEVYQSAAIYFDQHSPQALINSVVKVNQLDSNKVAQKEFWNQAQKVTAQYSWDETAKKTLAAYQSALAQK